MPAPRKAPAPETVAAAVHLFAEAAVTSFAFGVAALWLIIIKTGGVTF